ncbi:MAG: hypothetical protein ABWY12_06985 [Burkholderiales bacterium]
MASGIIVYTNAAVTPMAANKAAWKHAAAPQACSFSPAKSAVRADQHQCAILRGHLIHQALNLALR